MARTSGRRHQLDKLFHRDGGVCHYCGIDCVRVPSGKRAPHNMATRDHIVPRFLGGENGLGNYVLSCSKCNGDRGNQLFYCECFRCLPIIEKALSDPITIALNFKGIMEFNKPVIKVLTTPGPHGKFVVHSGYNRGMTFPTFEDALDFALNGGYINRKAYK